MFSHNNSSISLVPVFFVDDQVVANNLKHYSSTTGKLYDERTAISALLLEKLITDGGRYTNYRPNVMLALVASRGGAQSGAVPDSGVEESKFEELAVVARASTSPAANSLIHSGAVTADELHQYKAKQHGNRQPFEDAVSAPFDDVHYQKLIDDAIEASNDCGESDLTRLDAHLERIRIYEAHMIEAEHRSLRDLEADGNPAASSCSTAFATTITTSTFTFTNHILTEMPVFN
jgi:hypothetical protein